MRRPLSLLSKHAGPSVNNLIHIENGTFYLQHPAAKGETSTTLNPPLFRDLNFALPAKPLLRNDDKKNGRQQHWAVIGASGVTTFLEILRGAHLCIPPTARSFPYLASEEIAAKDRRLRTPSRAIQYVGFNAGGGQGLGAGIRGAYLSARYESRREDTDWSVLQYLKGETDLNPSEDQHDRDTDDHRLLAQVMKDLRLETMSSMPVSNLSNGQTRRARIARALLGRPELLLLDEPFMGLDPPTLVTLSPILRELAYKSSPRLMLALRPQDPIPDWITHLVILGTNHTIALKGLKEEVLFTLHRWVDMDAARPSPGKDWAVRMANTMTSMYGKPMLEVGHSLTSTGIRKYDTYEKIRSSTRPEYFNENGIVYEKYLSQRDKQVRDAARYDSERDWSLEYLINLAGTLPIHLPQDAQSRTSDKHLATTNTAETSRNTSHSSLGEPLIELSGVVVKYGSKVVLGHAPPQAGFSGPGLHLTIHQNSRFALLGPNGSGKTTLLSLLTSDHPHSYSLPIKFFGRSRLPETGKPGLSLWDIQSRIGHSSPEIHAFFPKTMSVRRVLESAWAETFAGKPKLSLDRNEIVNSVLKWWEPELRRSTGGTDDNDSSAEHMEGCSEHFTKSSIFKMMSRSSYPPFTFSTPVSNIHEDSGLEWATNSRTLSFGDLSFGTQRLLLLLRAMIKSSDILILDEAFSGLSPDVREKAMCFLEHGESMFLQRRDRGSGPKVTRLPNMRLTVARICQKYQTNPHDVAFGNLTNRNKIIYNMTDKQLREKAEEQAASRKSSNYAFSGLNDKQALVVVSHVREEVPGVVNEWLRLPGEEEVLEQSRGVEMGRCDGGIIRTVEGWGKVWGL